MKCCFFLFNYYKPLVCKDRYSYMNQQRQLVEGKYAMLNVYCGDDLPLAFAILSYTKCCQNAPPPGLNVSLHHRPKQVLLIVISYCCCKYNNNKKK